MNSIEEGVDMRTALPCPYCGVQIIPIPTRKKKCPFCGEIVYVKRRPGQSVISVVTQQQAIDFEKEWGCYNLERKYIAIFETYGVTEDIYQKRKTEWINNNGSEVLIRDFIWSILTDLVKLNTNKYIGLKQLYYQMTIFLAEEGKETYEIRRQGERLELIELMKIGSKRVVILGPGDQSCDSCKQFNGKIFTIHEALEKMPIPNRDCTHDIGLCRCFYSYYD